jgi:hypothetical protein
VYKHYYPILQTDGTFHDARHYTSGVVGDGHFNAIRYFGKNAQGDYVEASQQCIDASYERFNLTEQ